MSGCDCVRNVVLLLSLLASLLLSSRSLTCVCTDCPLNRCNVSNDGFCLVIRTHEGHELHYTTRKCVSPEESICFLKLDGLPSSTHCPEARCCNNTDLCNTNETNLHSLCALKSIKSDPAESGPPASIGEFFTRQSVNKPSIGTKTDESDDKETEEEETPETKGSSEHRSCNLTVEKCRQTFALLKPKELVAVGEIFPPQLDSGEGIPTSQMSAESKTSLTHRKVTKKHSRPRYHHHHHHHNPSKQNSSNSHSIGEGKEQVSTNKTRNKKTLREHHQTIRNIEIRREKELMLAPPSTPHQFHSFTIPKRSENRPETSISSLQEEFQQDSLSSNWDENEGRVPGVVFESVRPMSPNEYGIGSKGSRDPAEVGVNMLALLWLHLALAFLFW